MNWLVSPGGLGDAWPLDPTQWYDRDGDVEETIHKEQQQIYAQTMVLR